MQPHWLSGSWKFCPNRLHSSRDMVTFSYCLFGWESLFHPNFGGFLGYDPYKSSVIAGGLKFAISLCLVLWLIYSHVKCPWQLLPKVFDASFRFPFWCIFEPVQLTQLYAWVCRWLHKEFNKLAKNGLWVHCHHVSVKLMKVL